MGTKANLLPCRAVPADEFSVERARRENFSLILRRKLTDCLNSNSMLNLHINGTNMDNQLKQFWELEEIPNVKDKILTSEEQFVETHFQNTYAYNSEGRFVVKLPFYKSNSEFGDSKPAAISRLLAMERKFKNNPDFEKTIQRIHERTRIARSHELSKFQIPYFQRSEFFTASRRYRHPALQQS
ncbi:DUF1758 domain-containing protein [Trichonephila clavipes]|nr:DUF1758 domain-containing protein [Trichonephila clavipes]